MPNALHHDELPDLHLADIRQLAKNNHAVN